MTAPDRPGYAIPTKCNCSGCDQSIDRGVVHRCAGCGRYFCSRHLRVAVGGNRCDSCTAGRAA